MDDNNRDFSEDRFDPLPDEFEAAPAQDNQAEDTSVCDEPGNETPVYGEDAEELPVHYEYTGNANVDLMADSDDSSQIWPTGAGYSTHQPPPRPAGHSSYNYSRPDFPSATPYNDPYQRVQPKGPPPKKRTTMKVVMVSVCVLLLIVFSALAFMNPDGDPLLGGIGASPPSASNPKNPYGSDDPSDDYGDYGFDDFYDYFSDYYDSNITGTTNVPRTATAAGVSMQIIPARNETALTLQEIYRKCSSSIVAITAGVGKNGYYWGTGIIMTEDGYIVTNAHIIDGADSATVTLEDDREFEAKLVGFDSQSDLAVLKIDATGLPFAEFGDSDLLQVGDDVVAIGNPLGEEFRGTMTNGIISAINRDVDYEGSTMTLLQTNAAINEGNSGGPLINTYGQVIGITNMKMISYYSSIEGIGFAIPTKTMKTVVDELISNGYVSGRTAIGVTVGSMPQDALDQYDLPDGLYVSSVVEHSDAYAQGVREGDIITAVNGQHVTTTDEVSAIKEGLSVGDTIVLTIFREGKTFDVTVKLMDSNDMYSN